MDKEIPADVRRRRKLIRLTRVAVVILLIVGGIVWYTDVSRGSVKLSSLRIAEVKVGDLETTITASGKIIPAKEEHIMSPITSRILEVYKTAGEVVEAGEPLMLLDLDNVNNELRTLYEQRKMKLETLRQEQIRSDADIENREMQIETKTMNLEQLRQDLRNERFLDSLGSGTGENVRRAEMALRSAEIELRQLKRDLKNQRDFLAANREIKNLEMEQFLRQVSEKEKLCTDARILSPSHAVLTSIVSNIGSRVNAGEEVAQVADLSSFMIEGSISDTYIDRVNAGGAVDIRIGSARIPGTITELSPVSRNSVIDFKVQPDNFNDTTVRPGLRTEIYIRTSVLPNVSLLPNGQFFTSGPGSYELFVLNADSTAVERRSVTLGQSNYDYVEVLAGVAPGERVVISDMSLYRKNSRLKIKK